MGATRTAARRAPARKDKPARSQRYKLRLYINGDTRRSREAVLAVKQTCEETLRGRNDLEIFDIYQQPVLALNDGVVAAPMLIKSFPAPIQKLVGDPSTRESVLVGLNLPGRH